jgi:four helix bundle protein
MKKLKDQRPKSKEGSKFKAQAGAGDAMGGEVVSDWDSCDDDAIIREDGGRGNGGKVFDLEERTAVFGEKIVKFSKRIPRDPTNNRLIDQLVGCGTSVGANYIEASESVSKKDFKFSISRCKKESKETRYFLRMIAASEPSLAPDGRILYREANELLLIFADIYRK